MNTTTIRELAYRAFPLLSTALGRYERENVATLKALVRPGMTCWDVGANIGQMTRVLSRLVGPTGKVVSVEPGPRNADYLRHHCGKAITVLEAAVSNTNGYAHFSGDGRSDAKIRDDGALLVHTITLDDMLLRYPHPHLVKIDIEGHELEAFRGATRLLSVVQPVLVVEFHGIVRAERDIDIEARAIAESHGYQWHRTNGGWHIASPTALGGEA
jgi:FkbM family methyltransferase